MELLKEIGDKFTSVGMVNEAEAAFIRAGEPRMAIDACASLNEWDQAVKLAQQYADPAHIEELLARYAGHLLEKGDKFEAMTLYRKAHKHTKAAQLLAELAEGSASTRVSDCTYVQNVQVELCCRSTPCGRRSFTCSVPLSSRN